MQERINYYVQQVMDASVGTKGEGAYLLDLKIKGPASRRKIELLFDTDTGIRIDQCAYLSRRLRERLEADEELMGVLGEDFELLVSSPGLGEPILMARQYSRHLNRLLQLTYTGDAGEPIELKGRLLEVSLADERGGRIVIMPEKNKKGGRQTKVESITLYLDQVTRAVPEAEL